jgi:hypothetical protein
MNQELIITDVGSHLAAVGSEVCSRAADPFVFVKVWDFEFLWNHESWYQAHINGVQTGSSVNLQGLKLFLQSMESINSWVWETSNSRFGGLWHEESVIRIFITHHGSMSSRCSRMLMGVHIDHWDRNRDRPSSRLGGVILKFSYSRDAK